MPFIVRILEHFQTLKHDIAHIWKESCQLCDIWAIYSVTFRFNSNFDLTSRPLFISNVFFFFVIIQIIIDSNPLSHSWRLKVANEQMNKIVENCSSFILHVLCSDEYRNKIYSSLISFILLFFFYECKIRNSILSTIKIWEKKDISIAFNNDNILIMQKEKLQLFIAIDISCKALTLFFSGRSPRNIILRICDSPISHFQFSISSVS